MLLSLDTFFLNSSDLMAVVDRRLVLVCANPSFERQLGARAGQSLLEFCAPRDREKAKLGLEQALLGAARVFDAAVVRPSQVVRAAEWNVFVDGEHLCVAIRDVTAKRRLEKELAQAQKLEAVGQLASGIAHEINTPIQFVGDNLTFIGESLRDLFVLLAAAQKKREFTALLAETAIDLDFLMAELPGAVEQSCEGVQRVAELVHGMKEFAHQDHGEVTPTDINRALERTITVARNEWKYVADLEVDLPSIPAVPCQAGSIRQVFLNLICNAAQAIGERNKREGRKKGRIHVSTSCDGAQVTIAVKDDGCGIADGVKARLFEPFFTTKPVGKGTGQGLAISRSIVCEKHGGKLEFESELGVGSTFYVRLPLKLHSEGEQAVAA